MSVSIVGVRINYFFFQAEDGIRDTSVNGVQTCALPISLGAEPEAIVAGAGDHQVAVPGGREGQQVVRCLGGRSEERRVGKGVDLGGRRSNKKKNERKRRGGRNGRTHIIVRQRTVTATKQ